MKADLEQECKKEYKSKLKEMMVERARVINLYIIISSIMFHFLMSDFLGLSTKWFFYIPFFLAFVPFLLNKVGFSFFIKYPFFDILWKFVFIYIFTHHLIDANFSQSQNDIITLIKLTPFMVTSAVFPLKKTQIFIMSFAQVLLYYFLSSGQHLNPSFLEAFIFSLFVLVFLLNSHFNHKQIFKDSIKTMEQVRLNNQLTQSEKKFRKLFESKVMVSCMANKKGEIFQVSQTWSEMFDRKLLGKGSNIKNLFSNISPKIEVSNILEKRNVPIEKNTYFIPAKLLQSKDNRYFKTYTFYDKELDIIFTNCIESTKEYTNSIRLVQQEKFAHLGKSSSGLAHDVFNPLASLILNLELSLENIEEAQKSIKNKKTLGNKNLIEAEELVLKGLESAEVIKTIVTRFRKFSHLFTSLDKRNDLFEVINTAIDLFSLPLSDKVYFKILGVSKRQYLINDEKNNFFQVFLNIFQNSYTSYLQKGSPNKIIEISVEKKSKTKLEINIKDFANGIQEDHLNKVFNISFSTKGPENMGGMGLFLSKDLIESKMGSIKLNSVFKEGTTVSVTIPYTTHENRDRSGEFTDELKAPSLI